MAVIIDGTAGIANNATDFSYTGTLTGGTGVVNLGSGQVYKDASGNVGIGTSSPAAVGTYRVLDLNHTTGGYLSLSAGGSRVGTVYANATATGLEALGARYIQFLTNGSERARIDSSGNLLVGTTAQPTSSTFGFATNASGQRLSLSNSNGNSNIDMYKNQDGVMTYFLRSGSIVGSISVTSSATSYSTSSDYRLKEDIAPMTGALAKVALLKPCTYKWKVDGSDGQGFIAHELAEVEAGCVTGEKDAVDADGNPQYQGIDTSFLVATLAAAIQELKAVVDAQATRITALEGAAA